MINEAVRDTLKERYLLPDEKDEKDMFMRTAKAIAKASKNKDKHEELTKEFYDAMYLGEIMPNSPALMNLGTSHQMASACFVVPILDSMDGIFQALHDAAMIFQRGGGVGFCFSTLRPANSLVKTTNGKASGPLSFLKAFDVSTGTVKQGGKRRGASIATFEISHPDVKEFITIKDKEGDISNFNLSVMLTDEFMQAVEKDDNWDLIWDKKVYSTIKAKDLFNMIVRQTWKNGEPGILFIDQINREEVPEGFKKEKIISTNPCIAGDTMVAVADGRVAVSIKQLSEEDKDIPVYCQNDKDKIVIRMMRHPRLTGYNQKILKVTIEGGHSVRVTENHKFILSDNTIILAKDLKNGDSLSIMNRLAAPFEYVLEHSNSHSQDYYWLNNTNSPSWKLDHRLIYDFYYPKKSKYKKVMHHIDRNGLNNHISNLGQLTKKAHDALHALDRIGDKNPMRRAHTEWSSEKWNQYHDNMSDSTSGKLNGRYINISNDELLNKAIELSKFENRKLARSEWQEYAIKNNLPSQFSEYRHKTFGSVSDFLEQAAIKANVQGAGLRHAKLRKFKEFLQLKKESDLDLFYDGQAKVRKICEGCKKPFIVNYARREQGFCSTDCSSSHFKMSDAGKKRCAKSRSNIRKIKRLQQINAFNDLKLKLERIPMKKEFALYCKEYKIPFRLPVKKDLITGRLVGTFNNWKDLEKKALQFNHRVISVIDDGCEDVYNGTVDEFHNFYIGHFKENEKDYDKFIYINNLQCGEIPLESWGACQLSAINLGLMVKESSKDNYIFDFERFEQSIHTNIKMLDMIIDINEYPLSQIKEKSLETRRIGAGIMGLADLLIKLKIKYGSQDCLNLIDSIMNFYKLKANEISIAMGKGKRKHKALMTIAPTGTTSMFCNASSGLEPYFHYWYKRRINNQDILVFEGIVDSILTKEQKEYITKCFQSNETIDSSKVGLPDYFVTAEQVKWEDHIKVQATFQKYVDNSISKTINLSNAATELDVSKAIFMAWKLGCKGLTMYRDGSRDEQVLSKIGTKNTSSLDEDSEYTVMGEIKLPDVLDAKTYKVRASLGKEEPDHTFYIHLGLLNGKPVQLFLDYKRQSDNSSEANQLKAQMIESIGMSISYQLRYGVPLPVIIKQLNKIPFSWMMSLHIQVGKILSQYLKEGIGLCEKCGGDIVYQEGCQKCNCGHSNKCDH